MALATSYCEAIGRRLAHETQRVVRSSAFWDEVRRWTGIEPAPTAFEMSPAQRDEVCELARALDEALARWNTKVDKECHGLAPHVTSAIGVGAVGLAIVLIAVPGPVAALTFVTAKVAIGSALAKLAAATGAGALLGKPLGRLVEVTHEKLLGSAEFDAVGAAAGAFRTHIESIGRRFAESAAAEAQQLVLPVEHPLVEALEHLREAPEVVR